MLTFNFDDQNCINKAINNVTKDWFNAEQLYHDLKNAGITKTSAFWSESQNFLDNIARRLNMTCEEFYFELKRRCFASKLTLFAYHCTRSGNPQEYVHGIHPLREKILWDFLSELNAAFPSFCLPEDDKRGIISKIMATCDWRYRVASGGGPYLFLSYKATKTENNHFLGSGPEIWWVCVDNLLQYCRDNSINLPSLERNKWIERISENSTALIIHCLIPYAILADHRYCSFAILRSYFNILDPEDGFIESGTLDLKGKPLDSRYILKVEEIKNLNSFLL